MEAGVCSLQEMGDTEKFLWPGTPQHPFWFHTKERQVKERSLHKDVLSLTVPDSLTVRGCSISFLCPNFNIFIGNAQTDQLFRCICKIWNKTQSGLFLFGLMSGWKVDWDSSSGRGDYSSFTTWGLKRRKREFENPLEISRWVSFHIQITTRMRGSIL